MTTKYNNTIRSLFSFNFAEDTNELRFVVIGETGSGKSETSNSILHTNGLFKASMNAASVTKECMLEKAQVKDRMISIVDTPGFFDADMDQEDIVKEIAKCTLMTAPGPHAFLLVIRIGRMSRQVQETVRLFREIFGEKCTDYLVVVFTGKKSLTEVRNVSTIEEYLETVKKAEKDVADILKDCDYRYAVFENSVEPDSQENEEQVEALLSVVDEMVKKNGGRHYTNAMLEEAGKNVYKRERELRQEYEEEKQFEMKSMRDEYNDIMRDIDRKTQQDFYDRVRRQRDSDLKETEQEQKKKDTEYEATGHFRHKARKDRSLLEKFLEAVPTLIKIGYTVFQIIRSVQTGTFAVEIPKHVNNLMNLLPVPHRKKLTNAFMKQL